MSRDYVYLAAYKVLAGTSGPTRLLNLPALMTSYCLTSILAKRAFELTLWHLRDSGYGCDRYCKRGPSPPRARQRTGRLPRRGPVLYPDTQAAVWPSPIWSSQVSRLRKEGTHAPKATEAKGCDALGALAVPE